MTEKQTLFNQPFSSAPNFLGCKMNTSRVNENTTRQLNWSEAARIMRVRRSSPPCTPVESDNGEVGSILEKMLERDGYYGYSAIYENGQYFFIRNYY